MSLTDAQQKAAYDDAVALKALISSKNRSAKDKCVELIADLTPGVVDPPPPPPPPPPSNGTSSLIVKPFGTSSPFNQTVTQRGATKHPNSDALVSSFAANIPGGKPQNLDPAVSGPSDFDYMSAIYQAKDTDPLYTVKEVPPWGGGGLGQWQQVRVPSYAKVSGNASYSEAANDGHCVIVQPDGQEASLWLTKIDHTAKTVTCGMAGKGNTSGDGLNIAGTAAWFSQRLGLITGEELTAGHIDHALSTSAACITGFTWPAKQPDGKKCAAGTAGAPAQGQCFQVSLTDSQIQALFVPDWQKIVMRAMAEYGMYVRDTPRPLGLFWPNHLTYQTIGKPDPLIEYAKAHGLPTWDAQDGVTHYIYKWTPVDWKNSLRAVTK